MFYPNLTRRSEYSTTKKGTYYANYEHYRDEIAEDCNQRCVYCDITLAEHGGEGMQLDHFKPQNHFSDLNGNPNNLVFACPKCNRLKSDYWPIDISINLNGLMDPFTQNRVDCYNVKQCGTIKDNNNHAIALQIEKLVLNRPARLQIRRKRIIQKRIKEVDKLFDEKLTSLLSILGSKNIGNSKNLGDEIVSLKEKINILSQI